MVQLTLMIMQLQHTDMLIQTLVWVLLQPNADANKAWLIDTDGDLVSNATVAGAATTGSIYALTLLQEEI